MPTINPHINFNGNAEEAFNFYRSVFGGEFVKVMRFEGNKIMHIALTIGPNVLIANDVPEVLGRVDENENRSKISVTADSKEEADRIFAGLSAGGQVEGPMGDGPWGTYLGCFRDKYGIEWIVECDSNR
ncbi:MAG: VOC family protein [Bacteroidetes bacterium]|nr:VOC family protein [Bacteroidota bacterium]